MVSVIHLRLFIYWNAVGRHFLGSFFNDHMTVGVRYDAGINSKLFRFGHNAPFVLAMNAAC